MAKLKYGIIQGRLTNAPKDRLQYFPTNKWKSEFSAAKKLGFSFIELFVERKFNNKNPIWTSKGRRSIIDLNNKYSLKSYSACNDYIIDNSIFNKEAFNHTIEFIDCISKLDCKLLILPLLGSSSINIKNYKMIITCLNEIVEYAKGKNIVTALETDLEAKKMLNLLSKIKENDYIKIVYDTGNRFSDGADLANEITILGKYIFHVHIKDKNLRNENVILGTGLVEFKDVFKALGKINYDGPIVFETVRGKDPKKTAQHNINFCDFFTFQYK